MKIRNAKNETARTMLGNWALEDGNEQAEDLKVLLKLPPFRRFLATIYARGGLGGRIYGGEAISPLQAGYAMGRRDMAREILAMADGADGKLYWKALTERRELEEKRRLEIEMAMEKANNEED